MSEKPTMKEWESTGLQIEVKHKHHRDPPRLPDGQHLWIFVGMWRVEPRAERIHLDAENLLSIEGPGCYYCEKPWTSQLASQPCTRS